LKLVIKRNQEAMKGMLGGNKGVQFTLSCRLDLTPEETQLVERYKLEHYPLTWTNSQNGRVPGDTIGSLVRGSAETLTDVTTLVGNENTIKNACDALPELFEVVRTFGGEEVVEYPRS
jgi:hypothetical protein